MKKSAIIISLVLALTGCGNVQPTQSNSAISIPSDAHLLATGEISAEDSAFYDSFAEPLITIPRKQFIKKSNKRALVKRDLLTQYAERKADIQDYFPELTEQETFLAFIMLKVNGSKPVYSTNDFPKSFKELIYSPYGHCQSYALEVSTLLRLFGMDSDNMGFDTKHLIYGHVVTLYYDQDAKAAYLIDANSNALIKYDNAGGDFVSMLEQHSTEEVSEHLTIYQFPYYERYYKFDKRYQKNLTQKEKETTLYLRNFYYSVHLQEGWLPSLTEHKDWLLESFNKDIGVPSGVFTPEQGAKHIGYTNYQKIWQ